MTEIVALEPREISVGGVVLLNGKPHKVLKKRHYRTTKKYDINTDYGGGVEYVLRGKYILIYENHYKDWKLVKVKEKKGLLIQSTEWLPYEIKILKLIKPNSVAIQAKKMRYSGFFGMLKEVLKEIIKSKPQEK
jgi:hypothetical protein